VVSFGGGIPAADGLWVKPHGAARANARDNRRLNPQPIILAAPAASSSQSLFLISSVDPVLPDRRALQSDSLLRTFDRIDAIKPVGSALSASGFSPLDE
jgi:hypothetical protein